MNAHEFQEVNAGQRTREWKHGTFRILQLTGVDPEILEREGPELAILEKSGRGNYSFYAQKYFLQCFSHNHQSYNYTYY